MGNVIAGTQPQPQERRGFALLIGFDDAAAAAAGTDVESAAEVLGALVDRVAPGAQRELTIVTAPVGAEGGNLDLVKRTLRSGPDAAPQRAAGVPPRHPAAPAVDPVVVIDISRHRLTVRGDAVPLTYGEFELLRCLVRQAGSPLRREDLLRDIGARGDAGAPDLRAIDSVVRRVRQKLAPFGDVIRTVRGVGYRFDPHPGVLVQDDGA
jgi:hypothetical protein